MVGMDGGRFQRKTGEFLFGVEVCIVILPFPLLSHTKFVGDPKVSDMLYVQKVTYLGK